MVVPSVAVAVAEKETVTAQLGLQGLLMKLAVTPAGRADVTEKVTAVAVPLARVAMIDDVELVRPRATVRPAGIGVESWKSKAGDNTVRMVVPMLVPCVESPA